MASASNAQLGTGSIRQNFAKKYRNTGAFTISLTKITENKDINANCRRKNRRKVWDHSRGCREKVEEHADQKHVSDSSDYQRIEAVITLRNLIYPAM